MVKLTFLDSEIAPTLRMEGLNKRAGKDLAMWPIRFDVELILDESTVPSRFTVSYFASGGSRVTFVSTSPEFNFALKISSSNKQDNDNEYLSAVAMPSYLVPTIYGL
eukprot:449361-Karenia_brevis.AAC.1